MLASTTYANSNESDTNYTLEDDFMKRNFLRLPIHAASPQSLSPKKREGVEKNVTGRGQILSYQALLEDTNEKYS
jgi:hypothetical protein